MRHRAPLAARILFAAATALAVPAAAQGPDFEKVQIKTEKVAEGIWVLAGAGGNIGVSAGADGVFLIDDEWAPLTPKVKAAVASSPPSNLGCSVRPSACRTVSGLAPDS